MTCLGDPFSELMGDSLYFTKQTISIKEREAIPVSVLVDDSMQQALLDNSTLRLADKDIAINRDTLQVTGPRTILISDIKLQFNTVRDLQLYIWLSLLGIHKLSHLCGPFLLLLVFGSFRLLVLYIGFVRVNFKPLEDFNKIRDVSRCGFQFR